MWLARHHFVLRLDQQQTKNKCLKVIHFSDKPLTSADIKGNDDAGSLVIRGAYMPPFTLNIDVQVNRCEVRVNLPPRRETSLLTGYNMGRISEQNCKHNNLSVS
jgi:hypothetical protein